MSSSEILHRLLWLAEDALDGGNVRVALRLFASASGTMGAMDLAACQIHGALRERFNLLGAQILDMLQDSQRARTTIRLLEEP